MAGKRRRKVPRRTFAPTNEAGPTPEENAPSTSAAESVPESASESITESAPESIPESASGSKSESAPGEYVSVPSCSNQEDPRNKPGPSSASVFIPDTPEEMPRSARRAMENLQCSPEELAAATDEVRGWLTYSGDLRKLKDLMDKRLCQTGWRVNVLTKCRELVLQTNKVKNYKSLLANVKDFARESVSERVKDDVHFYLYRAYDQARQLRLKEAEETEEIVQQDSSCTPST